MSDETGTSAPERIVHTMPKERGFYEAREVEYVRKDLHEAERQRAEKAEASEADAVAEYHSIRRELSDMRERAEKAEAALEDIAMITPMWEGGMGVSKVNLANTLEEARQIARAALRQDEGD